MHRIVELGTSGWSPSVSFEESRRIAGELELGKVIYLPHLGFELLESEKRFLEPRWLSGTHKNISYEPLRAADTGGVRGACGSQQELMALAVMVQRFGTGALSLIRALLPAYATKLQVAPTSYRPGNVGQRKLSRRKDDTLLHVDAFPSRPNRGARILRVFSNVHPGGRQRMWKIGDLFEDTAREFSPRVKSALPGSAALLHALHVTKSRRSGYDHVMLKLHDSMKGDQAYQQRPSHLVFGFAPGSTWICFSDQTAHAALSGQYLFEQTFHLPVNALYFPERSPLKVLERLRGTVLV